MIKIIDKMDCCGCTACASICPKNCIVMESDDEGFIYPRVDLNSCAQCNLCEQVCPQKRKEERNNSIPETVVARDNRKKILSLGTSGSIFTAIIENILANNGVVYGVIIDDDKVVKHVRVDSLQDRKVIKIPCSKYVKSEIRGIYLQVKDDLQSGKTVCFSGTPCQVAGLKSFLRKEYSNLICVDLVCRGNPSPLFWKRFVEYLESKYKSTIIDVRFRNKTYGYHSGTMKVLFENGKVYYGSARTNYYLKAFFADLCSRPSCYKCKFKHLQHESDLTLYDSWHASELADLQDDDKGYTNIIIQSEKGRNLLNKLNTIEVYPTDTRKAVELDGVMVENSVKWSEKREMFFENMDNEDIRQHCLKFIDVSLKDYFIERIKRIYYHKKFKEYM
mgnify:CR=1 FL=1